jgi:signal transduction histidine kinase
MTYRKEGDFEKAAEEADKGIALYPQDNFYYKIKGDLLLEQRIYTKAADAYKDFLEHLNESKLQYFRHFAKFWKFYSQSVDYVEKNKLYQDIKDRANNDKYNTLVCRELVRLFWNEKIETDVSFEYVIKKNNKHFVKWLRNHEESKQLWEMYCFLFWLNESIVMDVLKIENNRCVVRNVLYTVSVMERFGLYKEGVELVSWFLKRSSDEVAVRSLFRLCRKIGSYEAADKYLSANPNIVDKAKFNIQYELFYYYLSSGDEEHLQKTLRCLRQSANDSIPISRTVQNFYIQLGKFDDAQDMQKNISKLRAKKEYSKTAEGEAEAIEATEGVLYTFKNIVTEQEHARQLIAVKELLRGFSHELGQPITNIRYGIQLYQMKMERHMESVEELNALLDNILKQTERLHRLLNIFSPIVDGKNGNMFFNCINNIHQVFEDMRPRLEKLGICYDITGVESFIVYGDPVKFDQVFYNLVANSADELVNKLGFKQILVNAAMSGDRLRISFRDNGKGIPKEICRKIFHPFFSTKNKNFSDGGTGLGLYIVWNIIKMYGGSIYVNSKCLGGAEFIIIMNKGEVKDVPDTYNRR